MLNAEKLKERQELAKLRNGLRRAVTLRRALKGRFKAKDIEVEVPKRPKSRRSLEREIQGWIADPTTPPRHVSYWICCIDKLKRQQPLPTFNEFYQCSPEDRGFPDGPLITIKEPGTELAGDGRLPEASLGTDVDAKAPQIG